MPVNDVIATQKVVCERVGGGFTQALSKRGVISDYQGQRQAERRP